MPLNIQYHTRPAHHFSILPTIHHPQKHGLLSMFLTFIFKLCSLIINIFYNTVYTVK